MPFSVSAYGGCRRVAGALVALLLAPATRHRSRIARVALRVSFGSRTSDRRVAGSVIAAGAAAALFLVFTQSCNQRSLPPSIVVILVDTMRADYLGAYGFPAPTTPNLDALAKESV